MTTGNRRPLLFARRFTRRGSVLVLALALIAGCGDGTPVEPALDLTGDWTLSVEGVCQGPMNIMQSGSSFNVTGSVGGGFCPFGASGSGTGSLNGREINFGIGFGTGGDGGGTGLGSVTFQGNVEPNGIRMSGSYDGSRSGTWEAVRN